MRQTKEEKRAKAHERYYKKKEEEKKIEERRLVIDDKLKEIFENQFTWEITNIREAGFSIEVQYHDTSFDDLAKISQAFNTKDINLGSESREGGYCETCRYSYTINIIRVDGIR